MGVTIFGAKHVEIANNTIRNTWGDGVYVTSSETSDGTRTWSEDINVHDNDFALVGRMGIAVIAARRVQRRAQQVRQRCRSTCSTSSPTGRHRATAWRASPSAPTPSASYAHSDLYRSHILAITGSSTPPLQGRHRGRQRGQRSGSGVINSRNNAGGVTCACWKGSRRINVRFTNNRSTTTGPGYMLDFENINGLVVTGNCQILDYQRPGRLHRQQHERHVPLTSVEARAGSNRDPCPHLAWRPNGEVR